MLSHEPDVTTLAPLAYHDAVVDYLQHQEADVWRWASARETQEEQLKQLRAALLRDTYRLEAEAHPAVHAALTTAMERLGVHASATLYQSPHQDTNASLVYVPGEIHIVLHGQILERMAGEELLAVFGHELAHYLLWSRDKGQYLVADRILSLAAADPGARLSHCETLRRYALHTELFADRGGAIAAGGLAAAVSTLVKVQTGSAQVDAAAYLRQAAEIESQEPGASGGQSHPETFIRARALEKWWQGERQLDSWIAARLHGPLELERLDLPGQLRLEQLTRGFLSHFLNAGALASDMVLAQVRMIFPDWQPTEAAIGPDAFSASVVADCVRDYLNALMLDLALADPDQREQALIRAGHLAQALGSFDRLQLNLRRDAGFDKRDMERYKRQLAKEARA